MSDGDTAIAPPAADAEIVAPPDGVAVQQVGDTVVEEALIADGVIDGEVKGYAPEGWLARRAQFKDGQPDGETIFYDRDGQVTARFTFAAGRLQGPASAYADGRLTREMHYADGVLSGDMRSYDAAGDLIAVSHYVDGQLEGESQALRPDGGPIRIAHYHRGKLDGELTEYWDNDKLRLRSQYKGDLLEGPTVTYLITGEPDQEIVYEKGKPVKTRALAPTEAAPARSGTWLDRLITGA